MNCNQLQSWGPHYWLHCCVWAFPRDNVTINGGSQVHGYLLTSAHSHWYSQPRHGRPRFDFGLPSLWNITATLLAITTQYIYSLYYIYIHLYLLYTYLNNIYIPIKFITNYKLLSMLLQMMYEDIAWSKVSAVSDNVMNKLLISDEVAGTDWSYFSLCWLVPS